MVRPLPLFRSVVIEIVNFSVCWTFFSSTTYDINIISAVLRPLGSQFLDLAGSNGGQEIEEREWMMSTMPAADRTEERGKSWQHAIHSLRISLPPL